MFRIVKQRIGRLGALLLCGVLLSGLACVTTRNDLPAWVTDPASIETEYPKSRYLIGLGVCGGASPRDVMSRKQAESSAISDIASYVEIQINDVIEQHDTTVRKNDKELVQSVTHQQTKREVTGLLSGVEIKQVFFDERTLNWHAMAVLDRAGAGRGALEAIDQRMKRAEAVMTQQGRGPLEEFLDLRTLSAGSGELERLAVAIAMFAPRDSDRVNALIDGLKERLDARVKELSGMVSVRVTASKSRPDEEVDIQKAGEEVLRDLDIPTGKRGVDQQFEISVIVQLETQHGAVRLTNARSSARYVFREGARELAIGIIDPKEQTAARADTEEKARRSSLAKLAPILKKALASELAFRYGLGRAGGR